MKSQSLKVSLAMQAIADQLNGMLTAAAGEEIAFVLIVQADNIAQYVSNTERKDGVLLIESLLERWKGKCADIPAHYNPDLKDKPGV